MAARLPLLAMYVRVRGQTDATKRLSKLYLGAYATSIAIWLTSCWSRNAPGTGSG